MWLINTTEQLRLHTDKSLSCPWMKSCSACSYHLEGLFLRGPSQEIAFLRYLDFCVINKASLLL